MGSQALTRDVISCREITGTETLLTISLQHLLRRNILQICVNNGQSLAYQPHETYGTSGGNCAAFSFFLL